MRIKKLNIQDAHEVAILNNLSSSASTSMCMDAKTETHRNKKKQTNTKIEYPV